MLYPNAQDASSKSPVPVIKDNLKRRELIIEQVDKLTAEMNRNELQWLQLCNLAREKPPVEETKPAAPLFKDAADINAVPIKLDDVNKMPTHTMSSDEVESESEEEE